MTLMVSNSVPTHLNALLLSNSQLERGSETQNKPSFATLGFFGHLSCICIDSSAMSKSQSKKKESSSKVSLSERHPE